MARGPGSRSVGGGPEEAGKDVFGRLPRARSRLPLPVLKSAALYFAAVFGAGFVLGPIRILWVVPRVGERTAELLEAPIMLGVIFLAARWIVARFVVPPSRSRRLGVGFLALGFLLVTEFTVVLWLRGLTIGEYVASRDPVAGTVYAVSLGAFAVMPLLVARDAPSRGPESRP